MDDKIGVDPGAEPREGRHQRQLDEPRQGQHAPADLPLHEAHRGAEHTQNRAQGADERRRSTGDGTHGAGAEIGHTVIHAGGEPCTCGLRGCFEAYASATALIRSTRRAMEENKNSLLWQEVDGDIEKIGGKQVFDLKDKDETAKKVVETYLDDLALGLINIANVFRPQVILLGGGVCAQGKNLTDPLTERLNAGIYGGDLGPKVEIKIASLGNDAGFLGAVALAKQI